MSKQLQTFSKLLERIMYNIHILLITIYYTTNNLGFNKNVLLIKQYYILLTNYVTHLTKKQYTIGVFVDLSKAFDTVDHNILFTKIKYYGITNTFHKWLASYLNNRKQYVSYNTNSTDTRTVLCGVPKGSILGPLLFLLYINDLSKASSILSPIMFADDTNLFYFHHNIKTIFATVNNEWFKANELSLNNTKTKYSFFPLLSKEK